MAHDQPHRASPPGLEWCEGKRFRNGHKPARERACTQCRWATLTATRDRPSQRHSPLDSTVAATPHFRRTPFALSDPNARIPTGAIRFHGKRQRRVGLLAGRVADGVCVWGRAVLTGASRAGGVDVDPSRTADGITAALRLERPTALLPRRSALAPLVQPP